MYYVDVLKKRIEELEDEIDSIKNPIYCEQCGSCGEAPCCSPDMCKTVQLKQLIQSVLKDMNVNQPFNSIKFIETLIERYSDGFYCIENVKSYSELEELCQEFYEALVAITKANYASEMIVIAKKVLGETNESF